MAVLTETLSRLAEIEGVVVERDAPLARHTRFGLGGPADLLVDASGDRAFVAAASAIREAGVSLLVIGGGTNLVVSDRGVRGAVLRYTGNHIAREGDRVHVDSGAVLQDLVDFTIANGLAGIHTMTGVPGWVGGALYGNAGAYGNSINATVESVRFYDGERIRQLSNEECEFTYRESIFKRRKRWTICAADLVFTRGDAVAMKLQADEILGVRNAKYPPSMKCAGSIFKNLFLANLPEPVQKQVPERVVREGKVPSAWFLEQVDAKGMRSGDIHVADYHANLIYNAGHGNARQVRDIVDDLKARVRARFGFDIEEEVQYVGFDA